MKWRNVEEGAEGMRVDLRSGTDSQGCKRDLRRGERRKSGEGQEEGRESEEWGGSVSVHGRAESKRAREGGLGGSHRVSRRFRGLRSGWTRAPSSWGTNLWPRRGSSQHGLGPSCVGGRRPAPGGA